jgi:rhomboid domain-containing protein 1
LIHVDVIYPALNSWSILQTARSFEPWLRTLKFLYLVALFAFLSDLVMCCISFAASQILNYETPTHSVVGLSGAIFALVVVPYSFIQGSVYFCGIVKMPASLYPWAMLIWHQILPNTSFVGHLSGVIVGHAYTLGLLDAVASW